ncbi:hypothetical protein P167DRAFT_333481 [Morchella conica CCBAS932]|uniref:Uncharacterized protein n=1 Tax=Morchella conica CCBAS932 TaxID=1392247 RepID=A0A3N4KE22_9PEZI|nr:hypothetical protein P167DRAFT_333481 [Morchella conica CCBAS932]
MVDGAELGYIAHHIQAANTAYLSSFIFCMSQKNPTTNKIACVEKWRGRTSERGPRIVFSSGVDKRGSQSTTLDAAPGSRIVCAIGAIAPLDVRYACGPTHALGRFFGSWLPTLHLLGAIRTVQQGTG